MEIEIKFRPITNKFDYSKVAELVKEFDFDSRNGLDKIVFGVHYTEIEEPNRQLHQIEKVLDFNLSKLDHWNGEIDADFIELSEFIEFLEKLKAILSEKDDFYKNIKCRESEKKYLENGFLNDIQYLIKLCQLYLNFGANEIQLDSN